MKHKHAELIKAWADGAEIQVRCGKHDWEDLTTKYPDWYHNYEYRIKSEPKPNVEQYLIASQYDICDTSWREANLKLTWDGETGDLKDAEVIKNV